jgi:hypothetical protein
MSKLQEITSYTIVNAIEAIRKDAAWHAQNMPPMETNALLRTAFDVAGSNLEVIIHDFGSHPGVVYGLYHQCMREAFVGAYLYQQQKKPRTCKTCGYLEFTWAVLPLPENEQTEYVDRVQTATCALCGDVERWNLPRGDEV